MVVVPGGSFTMGCDSAYPEEAPAHPVTVSSFAIDVTPVTNAMFEQFVDATGYVTVAERGPDPADFPGTDPALLVPGSAIFIQPAAPVNLTEPFRWWAYQSGVSWRTPFGPGVEKHSPQLIGDAPVVHVAHADAAAFAAWRGVRLPTEAEFEWAAWGGREPVPLGTDPPPAAHTWQGEFPWRWDGPGAPGPRRVGEDTNAYGVSDLLGNVWEWTDDWFDHRHAVAGHPCCAPVDPRGPSAASVFDPALPTVPFKVAKGGSFLCSPDYCARYRPSARLGQAIDTSTVHLGFRCAADLNPPSGVS
jgi:formylglycine-generating enzyme